MAVLSNNGRLIVTLPVVSTLEDTDQLIIQSVSNVNPNGVTKRASYGFVRTDLSTLVISDIQNTPTLKLTGSFYSLNGGIANFYTTRIRNGLTITTGGITVSSGASSFQSVTATQFNGPLTGNVSAVSVNASGTSNFDTILVTNTIVANVASSGLSTFANLQMAGGLIGGTPGAVTINNSPIGNTAPSTITGTKITGSLGIKSLLGLVVDSYARISGTTYANGGLISNKISSSLGITGSLKGKLNGDIFSPTGVKILENGTGTVRTAIFYGTSSYASSSFRSLTASYALKTITTNSTTFSLSSSYASSSFTSRFTFSSSYASSSKFSLSSSYASSSLSSSYTFKSTFSLSSSYASSSTNSSFSVSSSYASVSFRSNSGLYASSSKTSLTSSYVLQQFSNFTNNLSYYNGIGLSKLNDFKVDDTGNYRFLYFSGSSDPNNPLGSIGPNRYVVIDGYRPPGGSNVLGQSALALSLDINRSLRNPPNGHLPFAYNYGPEAWNILVYGSGSLSFQTYKQSYSFSSSNYYIKTNKSPSVDATFSPIKIVNNSVYFWGEPFSFNTAMRDGALGIGVASHSDNEGPSDFSLKARLQIDVFSASYANLGTGAWNGTAPVRPLPAILVRYGSGSIASPLDTTFYVSGSGNTYIGGILSSSQDVYIGGECNIKGDLTSSLNVYIAGDCKINGNVTSSQDFRIDGDLTVIGSINSGGTGDGSVFHFLSTPVTIDTISNSETNNWITYGGPATGLFASTYTTARSAVLYVEFDMGITAGFTGESYFQFRRNNTETAFKSNRLKTGAGYTSTYGAGNQVIVPLDYSNRSFDYYLYANSTGGDSGTVTLVGYLT